MVASKSQTKKSSPKKGTRKPKESRKGTRKPKVKQKRKLKFGKALSEYFWILKALENATEAVQFSTLKSGPKAIIKAIVEIAMNVIRGNISLSNNQYDCLKPHAKDIEKLTSKNTSIVRKRKLLQKGGFLSALIGPALGLLAPVVGKLFGIGK